LTYEKECALKFERWPRGLALDHLYSERSYRDVGNKLLFFTSSVIEVGPYTFQRVRIFAMNSLVFVMVWCLSVCLLHSWKWYSLSSGNQLQV